MGSNLKYILDTNIFIEAARRYYSFDFGSKFWDFLINEAKKGVICSIDKVFEEIKQGNENDPLRKWAVSSFVNYFFSTINNVVLQHYQEIIKIVNSKNNQYSENAINEFLKEDNADAWIIAYAKYQNLIVVTHESYNPNSRKKVLIPNVCKTFKIECIDTFQMLKNLNFKL